jgi:hypothetical protein
MINIYKDGMYHKEFTIKDVSLDSVCVCVNG